MTLAERAYIQLRRDIVSGVLMPGQALRMAQLSDRYGMGFSPLREALNRLSAERLVIAVSLRGFRVSPLSVEEMLDTVDTRILIETRALGLSIEKGDDAWEAAIVAALHALNLEANRVEQGAARDPWLMEERHHAFHLALVSGCGSTWLLDFFERLYTESERYRHPVLSASTPGTARDVRAEHADLAQAVLDRDVAASTRLLTQHYQRTVEATRLFMNNDLPAATSPA